MDKRCDDTGPGRSTPDWFFYPLPNGLTCEKDPVCNCTVPQFRRTQSRSDPNETQWCKCSLNHSDAQFEFVDLSVFGDMTSKPYPSHKGNESSNSNIYPCRNKKRKILLLPNMIELFEMNRMSHFLPLYDYFSYENLTFKVGCFILW